MPIIKLQSSDGEIFEVDAEVVEASNVIKGMTEIVRRARQASEAGEEACPDDEPLPLPNVNGPILRKVIEWLSHHRNDPPASSNEKKGNRTDDIEPWDQEFLKVDHGTLFELELAANYLDIKGLLDVTCKTIANLLKGKTPEEIRQTFAVKNDFTPEEEEQIRKEYGWDDD